MNNQDTPETNAMASMRRTTKEWIDHAEKLERERNRLAKELEYIAHAGLSGRHMQDVARTALCPPSESIRPL